MGNSISCGSHDKVMLVWDINLFSATRLGGHWKLGCTIFLGWSWSLEHHMLPHRCRMYPGPHMAWWHFPHVYGLGGILKTVSAIETRPGLHTGPLSSSDLCHEPRTPTILELEPIFQLSWPSGPIPGYSDSLTLCLPRGRFKPSNTFFPKENKMI